jgi:hypothetical protein
MKDTKSILLLLVTLGLVSTWAYYIYDKNRYSIQVVVNPNEVDSIDIQTTINDSLRRMFTRTLKDLGVADSNKSSYKTELAIKVREIDSLRAEIAIILNAANITKEDLRRAEQKISELQKKMIAGAQSGITYTNTKQEITPAYFEEPNRTITVVKKEIPVSTDEAAFLTATEVSLKAMQQDDKVTSKASQVNYFAVACQLKNPRASFTNTDVYLVLIDSDGNVVQDDQWQSGMFSFGDNRVAYTRKSSFEYTRGDQKRVLFTIKLPGVTPGIYHAHLYHNGSRIGKTDLKLN